MDVWGSVYGKFVVPATAALPSLGEVPRTTYSQPLADPCRQRALHCLRRRSISSLGSLEEEEGLPEAPPSSAAATVAAVNKLLEADPYLRATGQV